MKVKTNLRAGDGDGGSGGGAGDGKLSTSAIDAAVRKGLEAAGVEEMRAQLTDLPKQFATFASRVHKPEQLSTPGFWAGNMHNGIPICARNALSERIEHDFKRFKDAEEAFPGQRLAQIVRCFFNAAMATKAGNPMTAAQAAVALHGEDHPTTQAIGKMLKHDVVGDAAVSDRVEGIGVTIPKTVLPGFIALARALSVYLGAMPVRLELETGTMSFLVQTEGMSAGYVERETDVPTRTGAKFASRDLDSKILKSMTVWSQVAMRRSNIFTDAFVLSELVKAAAEAIDDAGLLSDGSNGEIKGVRHLMDQSHVFTATPLTGDMTDADRIRVAEYDMRRIKVPIWNTHHDPTRPVWFTSMRDREWFATHRTNDGAKAWPEVSTTGALNGVPVFATTKIGISGDPGGIGSTMMYVDMDQCFFAVEQEAELSITLEATLTDDDGKPFSCWERDSGAAKVTAMHDTEMGRRKQAATLEDVNYGGAEPVTP